MALIKIEFKLAENNFNSNFVWLISLIPAFYRLILENWKKRKKNKKPRILNVRLVRFWFILSLFILVALPISLFLPESGKWEILGPTLIIIIFIFVAIVSLLTIIFAIIYFLNFLYKLAASLIEAIIFAIWCYKHPFKKNN